VTQIKGDGEAHPFLSPNDEFANFERWDKGNLDLSADKKPEMLQFEYARSALNNGLKLGQQLGVNPYKFGMIGSTDAHTGLATAEQENFFGKLPQAEPSVTRATTALGKFGDKSYMGWEMVASGYAAVWASENTRESIWDAMMRKETYATTGSRMIVRFFGGFDFDPMDAETRSPAVAGYNKGVPMGGPRPERSRGWAPPVQSPHDDATALPRGIDHPADGRPKQRAPPRPGGRLIDGKIDVDLVELDMDHAE
jgi:hypothetical protein